MFFMRKVASFLIRTVVKVTLGFILCFSEGTARLTGDEVRQIESEYRAFKGYVISGLVQQPCKAVQFIYSLQEQLRTTKDKRLPEKIRAIISDGSGVGGIHAKRAPTADEQKIIIQALCRSYDHGAVSEESLTNSVDSKMLAHQQTVRDILQTYQTHKTRLVNSDFLKDPQSYENFLKTFPHYQERLSGLKQAVSMETPCSHPTYQDIQNSLKWLSQEDQREVIKQAYAWGDPIVFEKANRIVPSRDYVISLLWIYDQKQNFNRDDHLMGKDDSLLEKHVVGPIVDWRTKQPEAFLEFWCDFETLGNDHHTVIQNTQKKLLEKGLRSLERIEFKNIREIQKVKENSFIFVPKPYPPTDSPKFHIQTYPLYFKIDLAKALIADFHMGQKKPYVIVTDSDVAAVTHEQLFDAITLDELDNLGYVFGSAGDAEEENSFVMYKDILVNMHYEKVLKPCLDRKALENLNSKKDDINTLKILEQLVFSQYTPFKEAVRKQYRQNKGQRFPFKREETTGKPMIFPKSQYGVLGGYSKEEMGCLKKCLL